jgi:hypothetical protein
VINVYVAAMGRLALCRGRLAEAAKLFGAIESLLAATGVTFEPADQAMLAESMAAAKAMLGEDRYGSPMIWEVDGRKRKSSRPPSPLDNRLGESRSHHHGGGVARRRGAAFCHINIPGHLSSEATGQAARRGATKGR